MQTKKTRSAAASTFVLLAAMLWQSSAGAQTPAAASAGSDTAATVQAKAAASDGMVNAEVRRVDVSANKITLRHDPIPNLDMPTMTMVFQAANPAVSEKLKALKPSDKVRIRAEQINGAFVVTALEHN